MKVKTIRFGSGFAMSEFISSNRIYERDILDIKFHGNEAKLTYCTSEKSKVEVFFFENG